VLFKYLSSESFFFKNDKTNFQVKKIAKEHLSSDSISFSLAVFQMPILGYARTTVFGLLLRTENRSSSVAENGSMEIEINISILNAKSNASVNRLSFTVYRFLKILFIRIEASKNKIFGLAFLST